MKFLIMIPVLFYCEASHAFSWRKCKSYLTSPGRSLFGVGAIVSMSQFSSSWGGCSALGHNEDARKAYFATNFEAIQNDIVKGQGEALNTLLSYNQCYQSKSKIIHTLKNDFSSLFTSDQENFYENIRPIIGDTCSLTI